MFVDRERPLCAAQKRARLMSASSMLQHAPCCEHPMSHTDIFQRDRPTRAVRQANWKAFELHSHKLSGSGCHGIRCARVLTLTACFETLSRLRAARQDERTHSHIASGSGASGSAVHLHLRCALPLDSDPAVVHSDVAFSSLSVAARSLPICGSTRGHCVVD